MNEQEFLKLAGETLAKLEDGLSEEEEEFEVDNAGGVVTVEFEDGTKYIVNQQRAALQIWLAAGARAWHFSYQDGQWLADSDGSELFAKIAEVVKDKCGVEPSF